MRRAAFLLALLLAPCARAQLFGPDGERRFDEGLKALYDLDYEASRARFDELIAGEPDNPFSYLGQSGMLWWQSSSEYGLFKDTPTLEDVFERDVQTALAKGEEGLKAAEDAGDKSAEAKSHFLVGMALGTRGQWKMLRGHWIGAYFDGKHAVKHLNRCLELDSGFYDAYIGLGLYDYQTDRLPRVLRLSALLFVRGNAKRGLERLQLAFERSRYTPSYAAQYLASIYTVDQRDDAKALPYLRYLRSRYPSSPYFRLLEASALARLGDPAAFDAARSLAEAARRDPAFFGRKQLSLWCGLYGDRCLSTGGVRAAREWFSKALEREAGRAPTFWSCVLHFYRGVCLDLLGEREGAKADYEAALAGPGGEAAPLARHCLETACGRDEVLRELKAMSLGSAPAPSQTVQ
jgi:hypothetical protein